MGLHPPPPYAVTRRHRTCLRCKDEEATFMVGHIRHYYLCSFCFVQMCVFFFVLEAFGIDCTPHKQMWPIYRCGHLEKEKVE